ncbi:MAG: TolC family protein [Polyangiales bacterium]
MRLRAGLVLFVSLTLANSARADRAASELMTIDEAVAVALEHNLDLLAIRYEVDIAAARIVTARILNNPYVSAGFDYLDLLGSDFKNNAATGAGPSETNVRLDYPVELGGKRRKRIAYAKADRTVSELLLLNSVRELRYAVQAACVQVLLKEALLDLGRKDLSIFEGIVDINEARVRSGDLAEAELMRTQLAARERANIVRLTQLSVRLARLQLQVLLGRYANGSLVDVSGPLTRDPLDHADFDTVLTEALDQRPDVRALAAAEIRSDADVQLQRALGWINMNVGVQFHHQYGYADAKALGFFVAIPLPFFDRNQGDIQRARQTLEQSLAETKAFRASVDREVADALSEYAVARELLEAIEGGMIKEAHDVRETSEYAYRRGEISFVEFLDAQRAFNETMRSYEEALASYALARYRIDYVTARSVEP